jgi:hypothetical protein
MRSFQASLLAALACSDRGTPGTMTSIGNPISTAILLPLYKKHDRQHSGEYEGNYPGNAKVVNPIE